MYLGHTSSLATRKLSYCTVIPCRPHVTACSPPPALSFLFNLNCVLCLIRLLNSLTVSSLHSNGHSFARATRQGNVVTSAFTSRLSLPLPFSMIYCAFPPPILNLFSRLDLHDKCMPNSALLRINDLAGKQAKEGQVRSDGSMPCVFLGNPIKRIPTPSTYHHY